MKLIRYPHLSKTRQSECVATIGNFDGVHIGHRQIIQQVIEQADKQDAASMVISFEPLPNEYFCKTFNKPIPKRIYPFRDKFQWLKALRLDRFTCLNFDSQLANMEAEQFVEEILSKHLHVKHLIVGDDFKFGKGRKGDFLLLKEMGQKLGMSVEDTKTILHNETRISSSRVREALEKGDIETATSLLGAPYQLSGRVRHGDKRGRTIGFPTLNMLLPENIVAAKGVYATTIAGLGDQIYQGVANLGTRPTVEGTELRLETHVFDYAGDAYGKKISVTLEHFIRPEQKFDDFNALLEQIKIDADTAKQLHSHS